MQFITGNILDIDRGVIVHQVDDQGRFYSPLARDLNQLYPQVRENYLLWISSLIVYKTNPLGLAQLTQITSKLGVASLVAQYGYGNFARTGIVYTQYNAFQTACTRLMQELFIPDDVPFYFPEHIGCDQAGGNWPQIAAIIDTVFGDRAIIVRPEEETK